MGCGCIVALIGLVVKVLSSASSRARPASTTENALSPRSRSSIRPRWLSRISRALAPDPASSAALCRHQSVMASL